ncbi:hypothetical protein [Thalassospira aquimaris]|uniref:Uncharacterized protein n=1 Tax=Thalassospira aquimaris TaxID=3037796 RepID=A0ABT6GHN1_9PROT|nr:hypothetical protein [Thalassospira sp. FZY0004]MDG4721585.1 hypothetical protein [Thalassospira sp. FZY0004]
MAGNIPQPVSANVSLPIDAAGQGARAANAIAGGIGALAQGAERAYVPILEKQQRQEQLVEKTNLLKLQRSVEDDAIRGFEEISSRPGFAQLSTEEAIAEFDTRVEKLVDAELDRLGKEGAERDYLREQALNTKRIASARYGLGEANSKAKIDDVNSTLTSETNIISNRTYDNPDELAASLEELRDTYAVYGDVLGGKRINDALRTAFPVHIEAAVKGFVNQGRFEDARDLLNDKGAIKVTSALTVDQRDSMLGGVDRAEQAVIKAQQKAAAAQQEMFDATALVGAAFGGAVILDDKNKEHRDAVNLFFGEQMAPQLANMSAEDRTDTLAEFVGGVKVVPDQVKTMIRTAKFAPPEQQAETAAFIAKVDELAPGLLEATAGLNDVDMARSGMINSMIAAGQSVSTAVERTNQLVDPNNAAMVKARKEAFSDIDAITADQVADHFDSVFSWQADVPDHLVASLERDVNGVFSRQYQLTGDEDLSREYALKQMSKTWGQTSADGGTRMMRYPPEAFYAFNDDNGWMTVQLLTDVSEFTGAAADDLEDRVFIRSDELTARQASMQAPTYQVLLKDDNGALVPLAVRWAPDSAKAAKEWRAAQIEAAREARDRSPTVDIPIKINGEDAGSLIKIGKFDWGNMFTDSTWRPRDPETGEVIEPAPFFGEGPDSNIAPDLNE